MDEPDFGGFYLEQGFRLADPCPSVARFEAAQSETDPELPGEVTDSWIEHEAWAAGVGHRSITDVAAKLSLRDVRGDLDALPGGDKELLELLDGGELGDPTDLISFGIQFSF